MNLKLLLIGVFTSSAMMLSAPSFSDMTGTWIFIFPNDTSLTMVLNENDGTITGSVPQYKQPISGTTSGNGFIFHRSGGGLSIPQFFGGSISSDSDVLRGAFCHNHSDCTLTFKAIKN